MAGSASAGAATTSEALRHLSEEEIQELREIFSLVDKDGGGTISAKELSELLSVLGLSVSDGEVQQMIAEIDVDGNGCIDFEEFAEVMTRKVTAEYTPEQVKDAFSVFASAGGGASANRGYIRKADLVTALSTYGEDPLTATEAEELVSHLETDAGGYIHYDEFVDVVLSDSLRRHGGGAGAGAAASGSGAAASGRKRK